MSVSWSEVALGEVLRRSTETILPSPEEQYREVTMKLWGKGVVLRRAVSGAELAGAKRYVARAGQFIVSRIDARNGALGLVPPELDGAVVSNDFPVFDIDTTRLFPAFLGWQSKTRGFVALCRSASEGTTNRVRLREDLFTQLVVPLPPLAEQQRIVARIEGVAGKVEHIRSLHRSVEEDSAGLLRAAFRSVGEGAPRRPMKDVAPLCRRPVTVDVDATYPQVSARSFGRGTFHSGVLPGVEITWQRPYLVRAGDILISNIKAWEGAVAIVAPEDDGRVASHRYLTCVAIEGLASPRFVSFYLLTSEGLAQLGQASPGSADRNRTLSAKALGEMLVPVPPFEQQRWFDAVYLQADAATGVQAQAGRELHALLPAVLDRAFKGGL